MKRNLFLLLTLFSLIISPVVVRAETYDWPDVDIDLSSCMPSGPIAKGKEWINPLKFWVHQTNVLRRSIEEDKVFTPKYISECYSEHKSNSAKLQQCIGYYQNRTKAMYSCLNFTIKMCKSYGGC